MYAECCDANTGTEVPGGCWVPNPTCSDPVAFEDAILSWLHARVTPVAGILFAVAFLQLFTIIATCTVVSRAGW